MGIHGFNFGEGTSLELALAATVANAVAMHYCGQRDDFFIAGHEHEELCRGAVSVHWSGGVDEWAYWWPQTARAKELAKAEGLRFEPINYSTLAVYPEGF